MTPLEQIVRLQEALSDVATYVEGKAQQCRAANPGYSASAMAYEDVGRHLRYLLADLRKSGAIR